MANESSPQEQILILEQALLVRGQDVDRLKARNGQLEATLLDLGSGKLMAELKRTQESLRLTQLRIGGLHMEAARVEVGEIAAELYGVAQPAPVSGATSDDELHYKLERAQRDAEVLAAQRDQARAQYEFVFKVMMSVYNLAPRGKDIHLPDGRVMRFVDPNAAETLHHLSAAIHAIPERLAAAPAGAVVARPDLAKLRELALAATPGAWVHRHDPGNPIGVQHGVKLDGEFGAWVCDCLDNADQHTEGGVAGDRNAQFIAAANPAVILNLIAAIPAPQAPDQTTTGEKK